LNNDDEIVIATSKTKLVLLVAGSLLFVAVSAWMFTVARGAAFLLLVAVAGMAFFGLCALVGIKKLFQTEPGLIINRDGIHDRSSGVAAGFIPWSDIDGFSVFEIQKQKMIVVKVVDPEKYIAIGGAIRQAVNRANFKLCGSTIAIASNALKTNFDELLQVLVRCREKYRTR
jgi:hypothetical protein